MTGTMDELIAHSATLDAKVQHHYLTEASPLILATICVQAEAVRVLLNHGMDVNAFDPKYRTFPLHLAASMDTRLTRLLLDSGASVNFSGKSPQFPETYPMTSLHFAIVNAHAFPGALERVDLLLDRSANINAQSSLGNTPLHMALLGGHKELTLLLLRRAANIRLRNKKNKSVVQLARETGRIQWIEEGVSIEIFQDLPSGLPLHRAIWSQSYSEVRELLETGHDITAEDGEGAKAWDYCIQSTDVELAQILVDYMRRHESFNDLGNIAFGSALNHMTTFDYTDQHSWEKTVEICSKLLPFRRIFDPELGFAKAESPICNYKKTFFIWSAELGRISEAKFFLACGSDVNAADAFGSTGLHYAVGNKNYKMVSLLIRMGANPRLGDHRGRTPLVAAESAGDVLIRELLLLK
jgi:ankyrin repeat protein